MQADSRDDDLFLTVAEITERLRPSRRLVTTVANDLAPLTRA
jgi:hypothetical protein